MFRAAILCVAALALMSSPVEAARVGGISAATKPANGEDYSKTTEAAVAHLNSMSNSIPEYKAGRVVSVRTQVVAGRMVHITYEATREGVAQTSLCESKVWEKLDGTTEVQSSECKFTVTAVDAPTLQAQADNEDPPLMGGFRHLDHKSTEARSAAVEYARTLDAANDSFDKLFVCQAKQQLVNGINYELTVSRGDANCGPANVETVRVYKSFDDEYQVVHNEGYASSAQ